MGFASRKERGTSKNEAALIIIALLFPAIPHNPPRRTAGRSSEGSREEASKERESAGQAAVSGSTIIRLVSRLMKSQMYL